MCVTGAPPLPDPQRTQAVLQAVSAVQSGGSPSSDVQEALAAASSPVLRIIIDNMFYPVTLDVLQQVPPLLLRSQPAPRRVFRLCDGFSLTTSP